jgi:nucleoside phosphorylase
MTAAKYPRVDIAVLTALDVEFNAVKSCLCDPTFIPGTQEQPNTYAWHLGTIPSQVYNAPFVVALGKGTPTTNYGALGAKKALELFSPQYVVFVGCAGGFDEAGQRHGDVAVSDQVYAYEYGKLDRGFQPRLDYHYRADLGLVRAASIASTSGTKWWLPAEPTDPAAPPLEHEPVARIGTLASGDKVVDDPDDAWFAKVRGKWPKLLAVEMEGAGVGAADEEAKAEGRVARFLLVRGISDMPRAKAPDAPPSTKERDDWKPIACLHAARFFVELVRTVWPMPPCGRDDPSGNDWKRLASSVKASLLPVRTSLGGAVHIERSALSLTLETALASQTAVVLVGPSGAGKSALVREAVERRLEQGKVVWFDCRAFERKDFAEFEADLRLVDRLHNLARTSSDPFALVALDGIDQLFDSKALDQIAILLDAFNVNQGQRAWRALIACQPESWPRISMQLARRNVSVGRWHMLECPSPTEEELRNVWRSVPQLTHLAFQPNFQPLLSNLKILDLVVSCVVAGLSPPVSTWVGESSVALWFWETEVAASTDAPMRIAFLGMLAERDARFQARASLVSDFDVAELQPLGGLIADRICRRTDQDQVVFEHDLLGDWARFRGVLSHQNTLDAYLAERIKYPLWHRAVRLYALYLLEHVGDNKRWRDIQELLVAYHGDGAGDLALEAIVYASDSLRLLNALADVLVQDSGRLLRRLLTRFRIFATAPDQRALAVAREKGLNEQLVEELYRVPKWFYWRPVLRFLFERRHQLLALAPAEVAPLIELWLRRASRRTGFRVEVAEMALMLGDRAIAIERAYRAPDHNQRKHYYEVALLAATDRPKEASEFALRAARRRIAPGNSDDDSSGSPGEEAELVAFDGPQRRVDDDFRDVVLNSDTFSALIAYAPEVARETALSVLIREREHDHPVKVLRDPFHDNLGLERTRWPIELYDRGPFLELLFRDFDEGYRVCTGLVDYATERWKESGRVYAIRRAALAGTSQDVHTSNSEWVDGMVHLHIDGSERVYVGGLNVYGWAAGQGSSPDVATVALMALERFMYLNLDAEKNVDEYIRRILERGKSVAFLKVLVDIGKRRPVLFDGPLMPLLGSVRLYRFDQKTTIEGRRHLLIGWHSEVPSRLEEAKIFNALPHRNGDLCLIARSRYFSNERVREFLDNAKAHWIEEGNAAADIEKTASVLIALLDMRPDAYELRETPAGVVEVVNRTLEERYQRFAPERHAIERRQSFLVFPMRAADILEGKGLGPPEPDDCWMHLASMALAANDGDRSEWELEVPALPAAMEESGGVEPGSVSRETWSGMRRVVARLRAAGRVLIASVPLISRYSQRKDEAPAARAQAVLVLRGFQADAVAAGVAVLLRIHQPWLKLHPPRYEWCLAVVRAIVTNPVRRGMFDTVHSAAPWGADGFAASAVVDLWRSVPDRADYRALLVQLVFHPRYHTVRVLFDRLSQCRAGYRIAFRQLCNLAIQWMYLRDLIQFVQHVREYSDSPLDEERAGAFFEAVESWCRAACDAFAHGAPTVETDSWDTLNPRRVVSAFRYWDAKASQRAGVVEIDLEMLKASHVWIPAVDAALDVVERRDVEHFWSQALRCVLKGIHDDDTEGGVPHEVGNWILGGVAGLILSIPDAAGSRYWEQVIGLPGHAHYWCESFLRDLFERVLKATAVPPGFVSKISAMLECAMTDDTCNWLWHNDSWMTIIGVDGYSEMHWTARHVELARSLSPVHVRWLGRVSVYSPHLAQFVSWLRHMEDDVLVVQLLPAITEAALRAERRLLVEEIDTQQAISWLLADYARRRADNISTLIDAPFRELLRALADLQDATALALLGRLGRLS